MHPRLSLLATALVSLVFLARGAYAAPVMVAGWDFSQYAGDGFMSIDDGSTFSNTLAANYSDFLSPPGPPAFGCGCGPGGGAFGTMYVNGAFGSTAVNAGSGTEQFVPSAAVDGSLSSNLSAPAYTDFDSFSFLADQGQLNTQSLAMIAASPATVVFEVDLSGAGGSGSDWSLRFGARTFSGTSSMQVQFSSDGSSFAAIGTANLTTVDTQFTFPLGVASSDRAYVRFQLAPTGIDQPVIDNVAIFAEATVAACSDGSDDDSDGLADFPADPGCASAADPDEHSSKACDNGLDDDGDGRTDWRGNGTGDPQCTELNDNREAPNGGSGCGIGPELALAVPLIGWLWRRQRSVR